MEFEAVIGLEIHAQVSSKTKMFCRCDNDSFEKSPNVNVCAVCMGFPGQLPVINKEAVDKGIVAALALKCEILTFSKFDRKNYFYPDSPKGFQISQYDQPLSQKGMVEIDLSDDSVKEIRITRLHLEDDAGKLIHVHNGSLVDFNRAGTPLMEIVSEPDMRTSGEAGLYAREVQKILRYVGSSEADMEKGMMRFDASVSLRPIGVDKLYPRAEIKNLNSFKSLEAAIDYEISRQKKLWEEDSPLEKPITVGWNDEEGKTYFMREKEESDDYRYFPEPDLPPLEFEPREIERYLVDLPQLPRVKKKRYQTEFGLNGDDARILSENRLMAEYFEDVVNICNDPKKALSFITTILMKHLNEELIDVSEQKVSAPMMGELINLINDGLISNNIAKGEIFEEMYVSGKNAREIIESKGLKQVSDTSEIENICEIVIANNPDPVQDVKSGKAKAIGFLIGMVMKEMKGQGNPGLIDQMMRKKLGI